MGMGTLVELGKGEGLLEEAVVEEPVHVVVAAARLHLPKPRCLAQGSLQDWDEHWNDFSARATTRKRGDILRSCPGC